MKSMSFDPNDADATAGANRSTSPGSAKSNKVIKIWVSYQESLQYE